MSLTVEAAAYNVYRAVSHPFPPTDNLPHREVSPHSFARVSYGGPPSSTKDATNLE